MAAFSTIDLLCAAGIVATLGVVALPNTLAVADDVRLTGAARDVASNLERLRVAAVVRNRSTAARFLGKGESSVVEFYVDGNGNGVRTDDIRNGVDLPLWAPFRVADRFSGVGFGSDDSVAAIDMGGEPPGDDPVRFGAGSLAVFTPMGTASAGTLYLRSRNGGQAAVRLFGETGRARVLRYLSGPARWTPLAGGG